MQKSNGAKLGGATGAMAPLVFWSRGIKKSRKVSKSKSRNSKWHQLFLPSLGATDHIVIKASNHGQKKLDIRVHSYRKIWLPGAHVPLGLDHDLPVRIFKRLAGLLTGGCGR